MRSPNSAPSADFETGLAFRQFYRWEERTAADSLFVAQLGAIVGAVIAALGYCAKLAIQEFQEHLSRLRARKSSLIELQSLLLASYTAFRTQRRLLKSLCQEIKDSNGAPGAVGYDKTLALGFPRLSEDQKLRHGLIRAYTMKAIRLLNVSMMEWLSKGRFFKSQSNELGLKLRQLEAHLVLWSAKYEFWIPDRPERAIVFLADEEKQGAGFPKGIEALVCKLKRLCVKRLALRSSPCRAIRSRRVMRRSHSLLLNL